LHRLAILSCSNLPSWEVDDRPLIEDLGALGVEVSTLPWDADAAWGDFDGALIRTPWDYTPRAAEFLERIDAIGAATRLWNPPEVVRWNLDKRYLRALEAAGIPMLPTAWIDFDDRNGAWNAERIADWLGARGAERGFLKPVVGASALGTLRFDRADAAAAVDHLATTPHREGFILQPYLDQVESLGEVSAIVFDGEFSHGVRKIPVAGDYRVQDDYGASDRPEEFGAAARRLSLDTVAAAERELGLDRPLLYARVDFLEGANGDLWLTELELVEPSLFFRHHRGGATALARAVAARLAEVR
jgi:hypothetical protein